MEYGLRFKKAVLLSLSAQIPLFQTNQVVQILNLITKWERCNQQSWNKFVHQELYTRQSSYKSFDEVLDNNFNAFMSKLEWLTTLDIFKCMN